MTDISVVIPTHNRLRFLKRAVESVLQQKEIAGIELIVVDDGTSEQMDTIRKFVEEQGGCYLFTGGEKGGGVARNLGIERANGDLIAFLDDDDAWDAMKLARQLPQFSDTSVGLCYTGISIIGTNGRHRYSFRKPRYNDHYRSILKGNFIGTTSSLVVRRTVLETTGGFDPVLPQLQDY